MDDKQYKELLWLVNHVTNVEGQLENLAKRGKNAAASAARAFKRHGQTYPEFAAIADAAKTITGKASPCMKELKSIIKICNDKKTKSKELVDVKPVLIKHLAKVSAHPGRN